MINEALVCTSGVNLHKDVVFPDSVHLLAFLCEEHSLAVDAVAVELALELLAVGQHQSTLPALVVTVEEAYAIKAQVPS
jgi:hypothetical protein